MDEDENIWEDISRRRALKWAAGVLGVGWLLSFSGKEDRANLTGAVSELQSLSETIDRTDMADPQNIEILRSSISNRLDAVEEELSEEGVDRKSFNPKQQNQDAESGVKVSDINAAFEFYEKLAQALSVAKTARIDINRRENRVLLREQFSDVSLQEISLVEFESASDNLYSHFGEQQSPQRSNQTDKLLPDIEAVRSGLNTQRSVYRKHLEMQRAFLDAGNNIRSGANLFENSEFEQAKKEFKVLKQVAMIEIPSNRIPYLVGSRSMKLGDYNAVFEKYQTAAVDLIASCGEEKERAVRNQEFDAGLEKLLQAREIFAIQ